VAPQESEQTHDALRVLGRTVEHLAFDDDGYEVDMRENQAVLIKTMCDWLMPVFDPTRGVVTESWAVATSTEISRGVDSCARSRGRTDGGT